MVPDKKGTIGYCRGEYRLRVGGLDEVVHESVCRTARPARNAFRAAGVRSHDSANSANASFDTRDWPPLARSLVCWFARSLVCSLVCLFVCLLVCLFVCLLVCSFVCLFVCLIFCLFVCLLVCLLVCLGATEELVGGEGRER